MMMKAKTPETLYYLKNRKRLLEYQNRYYRENIEVLREKARNRPIDYNRNREYSRKYREQNREKLRIYMREYHRKRRILMKANKQAHTSNTKKGSGDWHVSHTSMGMGDYYGTGIKAKLGRVREDTMGMNAVTPKKLKNPPRSLA